MKISIFQSLPVTTSTGGLLFDYQPVITSAGGLPIGYPWVTTSSGRLPTVVRGDSSIKPQLPVKEIRSPPYAAMTHQEDPSAGAWGDLLNVGAKIVTLWAMRDND
ncbi:hypothetical protein TIFTF001_028632 [Ficus carica]|uniref:Uncharacterized protein n=1 Tax=Ficus carica TaxID=3494 RepID=A0AA88J1E3_FICCA|nr:hypothetical protein TIFTF001_028632 [Ficus carica]